MSSAPLPDIEPTIGAFFGAAISSVGLLGLTTLQCWRYFINFPSDRWIFKATALTIWALEFVKSTLAVHGCYFITVKNWGNTAVLGQPTWDMRVVLVFTTCIILITHLFFIHKIWVLLRRKILFPMLLIIVSFGGFALGISAYVLAVIARTYADLTLTDQLTVGALACALAVDWAVTLSLVILLRGHRSDFGRTNKIVRRLIFYSVNVGLLTSLSDLVVLVLLQINFVPYALYSISLYEIVGNLYANSLLACLNSRSSISSQFEGSASVVKPSQNAVSMNTIRFRRGPGVDDTPTTTMNGPLGEQPQSSMSSNDHKPVTLTV